MTFYRIAVSALVVGALAGPALAQQSGRFPVFGQSAEREAFFEAQRQAEAERVTRLEEQRAAADLARDIARQEAEAKEEAQPRFRRLVRRCFLTEGDGGTLTNKGTGDIENGFKARVRTSYSSSRVVCPRYVFLPADPSRTEISIFADGDGVEVEGRIRRPGLDIRINKN